VDIDRPDQELTDEDRVLLVFGYLGPLALVTLLASRREFVKWHAKQGIALSATLVLLFPVLRAIHVLLERHAWSVFSDLFRIVLWMVLLGIFLMMLVCIVRGLEGERFRMPLFSDLADRL
jgi:uncharacterized membrane protein